MNPWKGDAPFTFSFTNAGADEWCFEFDVDPFTRKVKVRPKVLERVQRLLEDPAIKKVGFNTKFDVRMSDVAYGIKVAGRVEDVMFKAHICDSSEPKHALKVLTDKYTEGQIDKGDEEELGNAVKACRLRAKKLGWKIAKGDLLGEDGTAYKADYWLPKAFHDLAPKEMLKPVLERFPRLRDVNRIYATKDAVRTAILDLLYDHVIEEENLHEVYERELRLFPVIYRTESVGVRIFENRCVELSQYCLSRLRELRAKISEIFGEFNKEVPDGRLREYLFGPPTEEFNGRRCLGLPVLSRTEKTKQPAVNKAVLELLAPQAPIIVDIQEFAKHRKAKSDYVDKYSESAVKDAAGQLIIHADFRQIGPTTGRMACAKPPLQQTPKRAKKGDIMKRVRYPFGPRKGKVWIHFDYKSIEPRIFAEEAQEEDIIRIFNEGQACAAVEGGWTHDPYDVLVDGVATATAYTRKELDDLFEARGGARQVCKNNFLGWTYGEGVRKMAAQMGCSYEQAVVIIDALKSVFPGAMPFMRYMQDMAKRDGCIRNRYGRKCVIPPPTWVIDEETGEKKRIEFWYKATNYLIQGTAADMLKEAMIRLGGEGGFLLGTGAEIVMAIHDELVIELSAKRAFTDEKFVRGIGDVMADNQGKFTRVPTPVDAKVTFRAWSDPEELEELWT